MISKELLLNPEKLLYKKPFTRGVNDEYIRIYNQDTFDDDALVAQIPSFTGRTISQAQYLLELDPNSHAIMFNTDLPRLSSNPQATWDEANTYRAAFSLQAEILAQQVEYVNTKGMKFTLLNTFPSDEIHKTFIDIKDEWVSRNMNINKAKLFEEQKSVGDAAMLFYYNANKQCSNRILSYRGGYQLIPLYDDNEDMIAFSAYYKSNKVEKIDSYDEKYIYKFELKQGENKESSWNLLSRTPHGFDSIPVVYKRGEVAWERGQVLIDIYELLYNIYMIIEKKVGFPLLYIIGKPILEKRSDTASMLKDSSSADIKSDAKFLNPTEPAGFQNLLADLFKKIQICTSSILLAADEIKITADISGIALKLLRSASYQKAQRDIRVYDDAADSMIRLFKDGVSKELGVYTSWNLCKVRAEYELYEPQSETEFVNRLITQKQSGIISGETATNLSPDAQPDEKHRLEREVEEKTTLRTITTNTVDDTVIPESTDIKE